MPGFRSVAEINEAFEAGRTTTGYFRKVPGQGSTADWWIDCSGAAGSPPANYYIGDQAVATQLNPLRGIFHGDDVAPYHKHLTDLCLCANLAGMVGAYKLLDYVLFYPVIDLDDSSEQVMDNTLTLDRYEDGEGVQAMMVCTAPTLGFGTFRFDYIDQDGNLQTSPDQNWHTNGGLISSLLNSQPALADRGWPYLRLADGSRGIRRIVSYTNITSNGGLGCLVLVKELATATIREINVPSEFNFLQHKAGPGPRIYDGAFLGLIVKCSGTIVNGVLTGFARFVWG